MALSRNEASENEIADHGMCQGVCGGVESAGVVKENVFVEKESAFVVKESVFVVILGTRACFCSHAHESRTKGGRMALNTFPGFFLAFHRVPRYELDRNSPFHCVADHSHFILSVCSIWIIVPYTHT